MTRSLLLILAVLCSCTRATTSSAPVPRKSAPYQRAIVDRSAGGSELAAARVLEAPAIIDVMVRVRPDRRFVNAAADVVEISTGRKVDTVQIDFVDGAWEIRVDGAKALALPELATFGDALSGLSDWASRQPATGAAAKSELENAGADIERFYPRFLFEALHQLDAAQPLDAAAFARAARAAALLTAQVQDRFDLADPLRGRAVALLAIARSRDKQCCADSAAILATALGYEAEAEQIARKLPAGFARAFVTGEDPGPNHGEAGDWLLLTRRLRREALVTNSDENTTFTGTIDVEAAPALLENARVGNFWPIGSLVESLLLRSMENQPPTTFEFDEDGQWQKVVEDFDVAAAVETFDQKLPSFARARATRLVDSRATLAFYEAGWYSAVGQQFSRLDDYLGDVPGTRAFASSLHPRSTTGQAVAAWMANLADAESGRFERARVAPSLAAAALLGGSSRYDLFRAMNKSVGSIAPHIHRAARDMFRGLDARPAEMLIAGKLADFPIGHLARRDLYEKSALDRAPRRLEGERTEYLFSIGDHAALRRLAADRKAPILDRVQALCRMSQITDLDLHSEFEQVFAEQDYSVDHVPCYWAYLNVRRQPAQKERFAKKILEKRPDLDSVTRANIVAALGNALEAQGHYREAWNAVEPHIPLYSANILATATSLLQRLGRDNEAIELGREMIKRYPDADTLSDYAAVLWRMKRYDEAAQLFDPVRHVYAIDVAQKSLPDRFLTTFGDSDLQQALTAYEALIKSGAPTALLHSFAGFAVKEKRWGFVFALTERYLRIPMQGVDRGTQLQSYVAGYMALKETKGADAALQWFLAAVPASSNFELLVNFFANGNLDLLADFAAARPPGVKAFETASIIGAALALQRVPPSDERWNVVRQSMPSSASADQKTLELSVRHLLQEIDAAPVAESAANPGDRAIASFFIGVRAVADDDYDRALGHFLAAAEGPPNYPPVSWAISQLYIWRAKLRPWQAVKAEHL